MRLSDIIPGGSHTYSKSNDCFPANAPEYLIKGDGCRVQDSTGKKYIDWGMGLRSVILGHSYERVNHAAIEALMDGVNFLRPTLLEKELAELLIDIIPCAEMVKFGKSGSDVTSAAVKLARAYTGRDVVFVAEENPFISQHDWFIGTTLVNAGIPCNEDVRKFRFDDLSVEWSGQERIPLERVLANPDGRKFVAAIVVDPATVDVTGEKLQAIREMCTRHGVVFILDEMISGFRYGLSGVQGLFGVTPDLATFGKAIANGYAVSALCGKREIMQLGDRYHGDVFLLSGTYNAETISLAAAIETITEMKNDPGIISHINFIGRELVKELNSKANVYGIQNLIKAKCFVKDGEVIGSNPSISFSSMVIKTLFDQHMVECGILMPYIAPSYSHKAKELEDTVNAADYAMKMIVRALNSSDLTKYLMDGWCEKPVFRKLERE